MSEPTSTRNLWDRLGIRGRLVLWFVLGAFGAVILGGVIVYATGISAIQETLGHTFCQIASRAVDQFQTRFARSQGLIANLGTDVLTTEVALEQADRYDRYPKQWAEALRERLADEWRSAGPVARKSAMHPQLSHRLSVIAGLDGELVKQLIVYDTEGVALAAATPPQFRLANDRPWFEAVKSRDEHFVFVALDHEQEEVAIVTPVWGSIEIVGYVFGVFDYPTFARDIETIRFGDTGRVFVVDYAGAPLAGRAHGFLVQAMSRRAPAQTKDPDYFGNQGAYRVTLESNAPWPYWRRLTCIAPIAGVNLLLGDFKLPPWSIIVTQSPDESYVALQQSLEFFVAAGVFGALVLGLGGGLIAWRITSPLKQLQQGVQRFGRGEREGRVQVSSGGEIGELVDEFNRMAERVGATENELRAFAQAVADATDVIMMTDPNGRIYYVNPAFEAVTGYRGDEAIGETPSLLASEKNHPETYREMWRAVQQGRAWRGELWNRRKNGEEYPVDLTISPVHDEGGETVSLLGVHRDISLSRAYREQLESEVEARTREIAETQGLRAMGQMASMIAHDLRNALSTIKMNLQILSRRHAGESDVEAEHWRLGLDQVHYMEEILRDMLAFARPERLRADWYEIGEIIDGALLAESQKLTEADVRVRRADGDDLPKSFCDRSKVTAVLRNLIGNAVQAMPDGGELSVETRLLIGDDDGGIQIAVSDTGEGIDPDIIGDVSKPFFTTRAKGTGLGLAIVERIISQHGGRLTIDSNQGAGTLVTFILPTQPTLPSDCAPADAQTAHR